MLRYFVAAGEYVLALVTLISPVIFACPFEPGSWVEGG